MQGRTWKSFIKTALTEKKDQINIQHVKAHEGLANSKQQGNDHADKMAKKFLNQAEKLKPLNILEDTLLRRFPQQIKNLTKLIKRWSIERVEGKAWIFFIFAYAIGSQPTSGFTHTMHK